MYAIRARKSFSDLISHICFAQHLPLQRRHFRNLRSFVISCLQRVVAAIWYGSFSLLVELSSSLMKKPNNFTSNHSFHVECPICGDVVASECVEEHANKCLDGASSINLNGFTLSSTNPGQIEGGV